MVDKIGEAAGKIWHYLHKNGEVTHGRLIREVELPRDLAERAIGWLAREDKLHIEKTERAEKIRLK